MVLSRGYEGGLQPTNLTGSLSVQSTKDSVVRNQSDHSAEDEAGYS